MFAAPFVAQAFAYGQKKMQLTAQLIQLKNHISPEAKAFPSVCVIGVVLAHGIPKVIEGAPRTHKSPRMGL